MRTWADVGVAERRPAEMVFEVWGAVVSLAGVAAGTTSADSSEPSTAA